MNQFDHREAAAWNARGSRNGDWQRQLAELALACAGSFPAEEAQRLRELCRLLATAPDPALVRGLTVPPLGIGVTPGRPAADRPGGLGVNGTIPDPGASRTGDPAEDPIEALILANAAESAALALLGAECGYLLSRGAGGQHLASIMLPSASEETSAGGDTLALAVVGALALALAEAGTPYGERRSADRAARLN